MDRKLVFGVLVASLALLRAVPVLAGSVLGHSYTQPISNPLTLMALAIGRRD